MVEANKSEGAGVFILLHASVKDSYCTFTYAQYSMY